MASGPGGAASALCRATIPPSARTRSSVKTPISPVTSKILAKGMARACWIASRYSKGSRAETSPRRVTVTRRRTASIFHCSGISGRPTISMSAASLSTNERIEVAGMRDIGFSALGVAQLFLGLAAIVKGRRRFRIERDRPIVVRDRARDVALGAPGIAAVVEDRVILRSERRRAVIVRDRLVEFAALLVNDRPIVDRRHEARTELDDAVVIGHRPVDMAERIVRDAAAIDRFDEIGAEADRLVEVGQGLGHFPGLAPGDAAIVPGQRILRVGRHRLVEFLQGHRLRAALHQELAAVDQGRRKIGLELQRLINVLSRLFILALIEVARAALA